MPETSPTTQELLQRLDCLESVVEAQQAELDRLREPGLSRRKLFGLAGAGLATAAVVGTASPAAAANGGNFILGQVNDATDTTQLVGTTDLAEVSLSVLQAGLGVGAAAQITNADNVERALIASTNGTGSAFQAFIDNADNTNTAVSIIHPGPGTGLRIDQTNTSGTGLRVASPNAVDGLGAHVEMGADATGTGVLVDHEGPDGHAVWVRVTDADGDADGLRSNVSGSGAGITTGSDSGYGARFRGGHAPLWLVPASEVLVVAAPTTGAHEAGELFVDSGGDLYYCHESGTPGSWIQLNTPSGPSLLATPERGYDSRGGREPTDPLAGAKGIFATGETRVIDLSVATSIPAGVSGVLVNVTCTNTLNTGFVTVYSNAATIDGTPTFSTVNWFGSDQNVANTTVTALDADGKIKIFAANPVDVIVDVIGFYP